MFAQRTRIRVLSALVAALAVCLFAWPTSAEPQAGKETPTTSKGYSIHIAVSEVDSAAYPDSILIKLDATRNDLESMKKIATKQGFTVLAELIDKNATHANVLAAIKGAQAKVKKGDTLLITFAGHGSRIPDTNGDEDEDDDMDETWCLFDGHLIDDELVDCWNGFAAGACIVVVLDSCHSSTAARGLAKDQADLTKQKYQSRLLPATARDKSYAAKKEIYKKRQEDLKDLPALFDHTKLKATVISLAACQDNQSAFDDTSDGLFTKAVVKVWNDGKYTQPYKSFLLEVAKIVKKRAKPLDQEPSYRVFGAPNDAFVKQAPFTLK